MKRPTDEAKPAPRRRTRGDPLRVTLKDIAAELGVPVMTVSRALRNAPGEVSEATRKRVTEVAQRLGYRPNLMAQAMQGGHSRNIGVIMAPFGDFGGRLFGGIHDALVAAGYLPLVHYHRMDPDPAVIKASEQEAIHRLLDRQIDGLIIFPFDVNITNEHFAELRRRGKPLVVLDNFAPHLQSDFAGTDDQVGCRLAAEHLFALGHLRVGQIAGNQGFTTWADRRRWFEEAFRALGGEVTTVEALTENPSVLIVAARKLLEADPRPTAIFCPSDYYVPHLYTACRMLALRIPTEVSVVGYADVDLARTLQPPLTTLRQDPRAIGATAVELVLARCREDLGIEATGPRHRRLVPELVVRSSTAPPAHLPPSGG